MIVSQIVAASENGVIGTENRLPWHIPEDLKFFRETTKNSIVIMGRKTFESLGKPLPKRLNIVITRQKDYKAEGTIVVSSIEEALQLSRSKTEEWGDEVFICGGGEIYRQAMPFTDRIYLTRVHMNIEGDTTFPEIDPARFTQTKKEHHDGDTPFTFLSYEKNYEKNK